MYMSKLYKYEKDGIVGVGLLPEGATIIEEMDILNAEEGYELIKDGERIGSSVWLKDGESEGNYTEIEAEDGIEG
jgi:hypothetical protein